MNKQLTQYRGNYEAFDARRAERARVQQRQAEAQQRQMKHTQAFIDRFRYNANRAALVQSRLKRLQKVVVSSNASQLCDDGLQ